MLPAEFLSLLDLIRVVSKASFQSANETFDDFDVIIKPIGISRATWAISSEVISLFYQIVANE